LDEAFASSFRRVRRRILFGNAVFFGAGILSAGDVYYLSRSSSPGLLPTYGFALLFGIILGTHPVLSYVLSRCIGKWHVDRCPFCHRPIWDNMVVAIQTALLQRCPKCGESLRWRKGFEVMPAVTEERATANSKDMQL
jgi:hypothetical protein